MKKHLHFEGLRGIAALVVFFAHFRPTFITDIDQKFLDYLGVTDLAFRKFYLNFLSVFYEGELPVFIFWLMSAYVISIKLFDIVRNDNNKYLIEASTKRYFRLAIPVFFSSLLCFILMQMNLIDNIKLAKILGNGYYDGWLNMWYHFEPTFPHFITTTLVQVFIPGNASYNIALWTMNPELMGSLLCFGMFAMFGRTKKRFVLYLGSMLFTSIAGCLDVTCYYYLIFISGIMWCDAVHSTDDGVYLRKEIRNILNSKFTPIVLLMVGFGGTVCYDLIKQYPEKVRYFFAFPVKAAGFTLLVNNFGLMRRAFSIRPMAFLGKISFSFYLLHMPILFSLGIHLYLNVAIPAPYKLVVIFFVLLAVTLLVSYLFMKYIDSKAIVISDKIGKYFSRDKPVDVAQKSSQRSMSVESGN